MKIDLINTAHKPHKKLSGTLLYYVATLAAFSLGVPFMLNSVVEAGLAGIGVNILLALSILIAFALLYLISTRHFAVVGATSSAVVGLAGVLMGIGFLFAIQVRAASTNTLLEFGSYLLLAWSLPVLTLCGLYAIKQRKLRNFS